MILAACQDEALHVSLTQGDISLLHKKGATRDARNYRPITLLQVDYKIFAKMLVAKIKKVVHTFVSPQQLGFVPKRLIGEASHLLKVIQAYLDEADEEGIILALDWEKAFDRVSWQYVESRVRA
jgi:guanylate kinase